MLKRILLVIAIVLVVLACAVIVIYPTGMGDIEPQGIDLSILEDGSYIGTLEHGRFTNTLTVHIEDNRIVRIDIVDDVFASWITAASTEVFYRVIAMQDTRIDAVAGATVTTNAYLIAIENALANNAGGNNE
jgi:uncharacterized protein with FMN-binding domain